MVTFVCYSFSARRCVSACMRYITIILRGMLIDDGCWCIVSVFRLPSAVSRFVEDMWAYLGMLESASYIWSNACIHSSRERSNTQYLYWILNSVPVSFLFFPAGLFITQCFAEEVYFSVRSGTHTRKHALWPFTAHMWIHIHTHTSIHTYIRTLTHTPSPHFLVNCCSSVESLAHLFPRPSRSACSNEHEQLRVPCADM
jgi:hypothetical protein